MNQSITNAGTFEITAAGQLVLNGTLNFTTTGKISATGGGNILLNSYPTGIVASSVSDGALADIGIGSGFITNDPMPSNTTPITSYFLPLFSSAGSIGLGYNTNENLNFSSFGTPLATASLGAVGNITYGGTFTPGGTTYRFGGGGGTLNFTSGLTNGPTVLDQQAAGTTIISGSNTFAGTTAVTVGNLEINTAFDSSMAAGSVAVSSGASFGAGSTWISGGGGTITGSVLPLIATSSAGSLALTGSTSENLNLSTYASLGLGAIGSVTYSGTLTPNGTTYRLGGGGGTLNFAGTLADTSGPTAVAVSSSGTVAPDEHGQQLFRWHDDHRRDCHLAS